MTGHARDAAEAARGHARCAAGPANWFSVVADGDPDDAERVLYDCLANGLSFKVSAGTVLTLTPPLTITNEQMAEAIAILDAALGRL